MFELYKFAGYLLTFPGLFVLFFLLLALLSFLRRRRNLAVLFLWTAIFFYVSSTQFFSYLLSKLIHVQDSDDGGEVIVVLGGGTASYDGREELTGHSALRVLKAFQLYKARPRKILVSGGVVDKGSPEALKMREVLLELGVRGDDIAVEIRSRNTGENASFSFAHTGDVPITLVTSGTHMLRALEHFSKFYSNVYHIQAYPPADFRNSYIDYLPTVTGFTSFCNITREIVGVILENLLQMIRRTGPSGRRG